MKKEILNSILQGINSLEFKLKNQRLVCEREYIYILIEHQASKYSDRFFLNFGILYKKLMVDKKIDVGVCHFSSRYEQLLGNPTDRLFTSHVVNDEKEIKTICDNIDNIIVPFLLQFENQTFLLGVLPKKIPWDKIWLQNITGTDLLKSLEKGLLG